MFVIVLPESSRVERRSLVSTILWFECGMFILHGWMSGWGAYVIFLFEITAHVHCLRQCANEHIAFIMGSEIINRLHIEIFAVPKYTSHIEAAMWGLQSTSVTVNWFCSSGCLKFGHGSVSLGGTVDQSDCYYFFAQRFQLVVVHPFDNSCIFCSANLAAVFVTWSDVRNDKTRPIILCELRAKYAHYDFFLLSVSFRITSTTPTQSVGADFLESMKRD